jgi:hypothetical protein
MSINCSTDEQKVDQDRCFNHWPQYPCYDPRTRMCYSPDGVQLFDPVSDIYYGASSLYLSVLDFAERLLRDTPPRDRPEVDRAIRRTIHEWGPAFHGGPRPMLFSGDAPIETSVPIIRVAEQLPGRYYTMEDLVSGATTVGTHLTTAMDTIRHYRDRIMGNTPVGPPQLERRPSEERVAAGNKKTRRKKRKRHRKKKKQQRTRRK